MRKILFLLGCVFFFMTANSFAETVYLKNGRTLAGTIVEKTDKNIKINIKGVTLTYDNEEIEKIEGVGVPQPSVAQTGSMYPAYTSQPARVTPAGQPISLSAGIAGQVPMDKTALILELIEASGAKESMNKVFADIMTKVTPEEVQQLRSVLNIDELMMQLVPVYGKYFNEEELKALVAFYKSPAGHKLLTVTPLILQDSMNASLAYLQNRLQPTRPQGQ